MNLYGYYRNTTPNIKNLAEESIVFENAYAASTWTMPSLASIFTSKYPRQHKILRLWEDKLPKKSNSIQKILKERGYRTIGISGFLAINNTFSHTFEDFIFLERGNRNARITTNKAIQELDGPKPFFLWAHYVDPHTPYFVPESVKGKFSSKGRDLLCNYDVLQTFENFNFSERCIGFYDEEIRFADRQIGRLINTLKDKNLMKNTTIIITADHGEEFGEHGDFGHGSIIHEEVIRIPLIVKTPQTNNKKTVVEEVDNTLIKNTILELSGTETKERENNQKNLIPFLKNKNTQSVAISEFIGPRSGFITRTIINEGQKYIQYPKGPDKLYNLTEDGYKRFEIKKKSSLNKFKERVEIPNKTMVKYENISLKLKRRLKNLGYYDLLK